jgi:hypothetical protein
MTEGISICCYRGTLTGMLLYSACEALFYEDGTPHGFTYETGICLPPIEICPPTNSQIGHIIGRKVVEGFVAGLRVLERP